MEQLNEVAYPKSKESFPKTDSLINSLENFNEKERKSVGEILKFAGVGDKDVYNISAPFKVGDKNYIMGRVESQLTSTDVVTCFFLKQDGVWRPDLSMPVFKLEDPFITKVGEDMILGGVETRPIVNDDNTPGVGYKTVFYRGENLQDLKRFSEGPDGMKDIRLIELVNHKIGVFTRPQGEVGGRGKIGFTKLDAIEDLNPENISNAKIIEGQFTEMEWGGINWACPLENGNIGALGHIARQDEDGKKYYSAMSFKFNPETGEASPLKIIASRENFPKEGVREAKRADLEDIVFPGGLTINDNQTATLYAGLSDSVSGLMDMPNPFAEN